MENQSFNPEERPFGAEGNNGEGYNNEERREGERARRPRTRVTRTTNNYNSERIQYVRNENQSLGEGSDESASSNSQNSENSYENRYSNRGYNNRQGGYNNRQGGYNNGYSNGYNNNGYNNRGYERPQREYRPRYNNDSFNNEGASENFNDEGNQQPGYRPRYNNNGYNNRYNNNNDYQQREYRPRYNGNDNGYNPDNIDEGNQQPGYRPRYNNNNNGGYNNRQGGYNNNRQGGYNNNRQGGYNNNRQGGYNNNRYNNNNNRYNNNRYNNNNNGYDNNGENGEGFNNEQRPQGQRPRYNNNNNRQGGFNNNNRQGGFNKGPKRPAKPAAKKPFKPHRDKSEIQEEFFVAEELQTTMPAKTNSEKDIPHTLETLRLNRFIAMSGVCSRREADELIKSGVVTVNGKVVTEMGVQVNRNDEIICNGNKLSAERKVYVLLNKPKDCVTTTDDPEERKTVMDYVADACEERIYPVGRLDRNTTGVLLLTNDGELTEHLIHPRYGVRKIYHVFLDRNVEERDMEQIMKGVRLEDGMIAADDVRYVDVTDRKQVGIQLHSGKNRIVRRIFEKLGYNVEKLDRVYFAGLTKLKLPRGKWRFLTEVELNKLKAGFVK